MKLKCLALAGALVVSAMASSAFANTIETVAGSLYAPKTINKNTKASELTTSPFYVVEGFNYIFSGLVSHTSNAGNGKYLTASLLDQLGNAVSFFDIQSNPANNVDKTFSSGLLHLTTGFYTISFTFHNVGGGNPVFGGTTASLTHSVQAVPGPEAGAGIGALAMGGIAVYLTRRRKAVEA